MQDNIRIKGEIKMIFRNVITGKVRTYKYNNMFVNYGKYALAQRLAGQSAGDITYLAVGTGTTAPAKTDTALQTELDRKLISVRAYESEMAEFTVYFTTSEAIGTLREMGLFGNGVGRTASTTPGSGQLYTRAACDRVKTSSDTLTIIYKLYIVT